MLNPDKVLYKIVDCNPDLKGAPMNDVIVTSDNYDKIKEKLDNLKSIYNKQYADNLRIICEKDYFVHNDPKPVKIHNFL